MWACSAMEKVGFHSNYGDSIQELMNNKNVIATFKVVIFGTSISLLLNKSEFFSVKN